MDPMSTVAGVTLFGLALAELMQKRRLTGEDWPNAIPKEWRKRFVAYKKNPTRTATNLEMKRKVKRLCKNKKTVHDYRWRTMSDGEVTAGTMSWSHLLNTIRYCARKKNWGPWVYFVAEHRLRLKQQRRKSGQPTSKLTMVRWDEEWEKTIGGPRRESVAASKATKAAASRAYRHAVDEAHDGDYSSTNWDDYFSERY